jgi:hypothetical protein
MARKPQDLYPGQVITGDPGFPHGKARNVLVLGDGTGTPLEEKWVNEHFGFLQGLLVAAGITPDGTPETASASQYVAAIRYLTKHISGNVEINGSLDVFDDVDFSQELSVFGLAKFWGGFTAAGGTINGLLNVIGPLVASGGLVIQTGFGQLVQTRGLTAGAAGTTLGTLGDVVFQIPVAIQDALRFGTGGRIVHRTQAAPDTDGSFSVSNGDRIIIGAGVTGGHVYNLLQDAAAEDGAELKIVYWSIFAHTIQSGGTPVYILPPDGGTTLPNTWRATTLDLLFHNNNLVTRWLPTRMTIG